ncbi:probable ubiquitin carboxyl-terminal hydrolase 8 isoform X2 [Mizuhopecten yessoensis]|uniref:Ubiquitin carboxyl-terminal hydrolase 8 n=1 Tax=Mizuhopecten yessoensis TaxID=6573 RepID=A0A210QAZ0_MIZYE|nr:probable ubiquitin carboxyl-terminal hydrolase 8 isoform X2 [Mizuhopecten yessoensis]OWF45889.1 ubiquitin carboxyl-terminal hydrolase 8 [Mizuhopecten yessoensis]
MELDVHEAIFKQKEAGHVPTDDNSRDSKEFGESISTLPAKDHPSDRNDEQKLEISENVQNMQQANKDITSEDKDLQVLCFYSDNASKEKDDSDKSDGNLIRGLPNIKASSCYMSTLVQVLAQTPGFTDKLLHNNQNCHVASTLIKLFVEINDTQQGSCDTEEDLHSLVSDLQNNMSERDESYKSGNQNDCHSLYLCLMDALDEEIKGCTSLFEGHARNIFRYSTCDHVEECQPECIRSLLLTVDEVYSSVEDSLKLLEEIVTFNDAEVPCRTCLDEEKRYEDTSTYKQYIVAKPPEILVLQLARFKQDMVSVNEPYRRLYKYQGNVHYPSDLSLPTSIEGPSGRECVHVWYELYGVICHEGSLEEGHYWCYVKKNGWNPDNLYLWHLCADSYVRRLDVNEEWPHSPFAYLLFYKRLKL